MNNWQARVAEFHAATYQTDTLSTPEARILRAKLIMEEAVETVAALGFKAYGIVAPLNATSSADIIEFAKEQEFSLPDFIDGLCDLAYVLCGGAVNADVDLDPHFNLVHEANMQKLTGPKRADGKQLKPEGWEPPDHEALLRATALDSY